VWLKEPIVGLPIAVRVPLMVYHEESPIEWVEPSDVASSSGGAGHGARTDRDAVRGPYGLGGSICYRGTIVVHCWNSHGDGYVAIGVAACGIGVRSGCGRCIWRGGWVVPG
jgi:hypothetical protein